MMNTLPYNSDSLLPAPSLLPPRRAFTLVELLVVITIIGILAALITVAAVGALKAAQQTRIKTDVNQISEAFEELKNKTTAYPPNCQTDDTDTGPTEPSGTPLAEAQILNDLKRYLKQVAPKHREPDDLLRVLVGLSPANGSDFPKRLDGGMTAAEAVVFWLGGFSTDPKYPISGEGGPSYLITSFNNTNNATLDPITTRRWVYPFEITRLGPRNNDDFFDQTAGNRYIEYRVRIPGQNNGEPQTRRINFWHFTPPKSTQPILYFDTSRHPPSEAFDPPAATTATGDARHIHALKKRADTPTSSLPFPAQFVEPDKFQVLHCGIDDAWGEEQFEMMSFHGLRETGKDASELLLFPSGPFIGEIADTAVSFITQPRLEDAQP